MGAPPPLFVLLRMNPATRWVSLSLCFLRWRWKIEDEEDDEEAAGEREKWRFTERAGSNESGSAGREREWIKKNEVKRRRRWMSDERFVCSWVCWTNLSQLSPEVHKNSSLFINHLSINKKNIY